MRSSLLTGLIVVVVVVVVAPGLVATPKSHNIPSTRATMGLLGDRMDEQMSYYSTLTREERARMHPCKKAKCVMMSSASSSPTLQTIGSSPGYVDLPDEPRPGKITPSTTTTTTTASTAAATSNSSPSPRSSRPGLLAVNGLGPDEPPPRGATRDHGDAASIGASSPEAEEAIEEAVPIVRTTLPSPSPRPAIERNGYGGGKDHRDRLDGNGVQAKGPKLAHPSQQQQQQQQHDVDEDSCLIKCVYFTQQCCECRIA